MDPELLQQLLAFLQTQPQYDTKGNVKPFGLDEQAKQQTFQNNGVKNLFNPQYAALLQTGIDPKALAPVEDGVDSYDVPQNPLEPYLGLPDGSDEKVIASHIAEGQSPTQVVAGLKLTDPKVADRYQKFADGLFQDNAKFQHQISTLPGFDPSTGSWSPPEGGQVVAGKLVIPKFRPSDLAQTLEKAGIDPRQKFDPQDFGYDQQGSQQGLGDAASKLQALQERAGASKADWLGHGGSRTVVHPTTPQASAPLVMTPHQDQYGVGVGVEHGRGGGRSGSSGHTSRDLKYDTSTAQGQTYAKYGKDVTAQRAAEKSLQQMSVMKARDEAYANKRVELAAKDNFSPMLLSILQRARGLNQLGG